MSETSKLAQSSGPLNPAPSLELVRVAPLVAGLGLMADGARSKGPSEAEAAQSRASDHDDERSLGYDSSGAALESEPLSCAAINRKDHDSAG
jgi:hypothetical protein